MSASKQFLYGCLGFLAGNGLGRFVPAWAIWAAAAAAIAGLTIFWFRPRPRTLCLAVLAAAYSAWHLGQHLPALAVAEWYGQKLTVRGMVVDEPDERPDKVFLVVGDLVGPAGAAGGRIRVSVPRQPEYRYGDQLSLTGAIREPADDQDFSYKNYLRRYGIDALMYDPQIEIAGENQGSAWRKAIIAAKQRFLAGLSGLMPEPHQSFLAGILAGVRRGIPERLINAFNTTGTTHIIAVSGFNITIVAKFLSWLLGATGRRFSFIASLLGIAAFVVATGASASVVRAGIMGSLYLLASNSGRLYAATNALVLAAAAMVWHNPLVLHFDAGFQLSFASLMGLVYLSPYFVAWWPKSPAVVREYLLPTFSAQVFTLPLVAYHFGRVSLVSLLTNVLVVPAIPLVMLSGFAAGSLALVWPAAATPLAWLTWLILSYIIKAIELTAALPRAAIQIESVPVLAVAVYYAILAGFLYIHNRRAKVTSAWNLRPKKS